MNENFSGISNTLFLLHVLVKPSYYFYSMLTPTYHGSACNIQLQYRNCSSHQQYLVQSVIAHSLVFREPDTDQLQHTLYRLLIEDPLNFSSQLTYMYVIMTSAGIKVHDMTISSRYF